MTTKNDFEQFKPNDIYDVVPKALFMEDGIKDHDEYLRSLNYYEWYYAIAQFYKPKSYFEIGVRFGYSMGVMITAAPSIEKVLG